MNWLTEWLEQHPEYRGLKARRTPNAIHFEIAPRMYEAHIWIDRRFQRTSSGLLVPFSGLTESLRVAARLMRSPRQLAKFAALMPFGSTLTLQPDDTTGIDTYLLSSAPTTNYGTSADLVLRGTGSQRRTLIRFPLTSLPSGRTITAATLSLWLYNAVVVAGTAKAVDAWNITQTTWTETGATWNTYDGMNSWATAGGDYGSVRGSTVVTFASYGQYQWALNAAWADGLSTLDVGLITQFDFAQDARLDFWSSSYGTAGQRPQLIVTYSVAAGGPVNPLIAAPFRGPFG